MTRLAEVKAQLEAKEKELTRYEIVLHDIVVGSPKHCGEPIVVTVKGSERLPGDKIPALVGTIYRPTGAWPLLLVKDGTHTFVIATEEFRSRDGWAHDYRLLQERVQAALYRANRKEESA